MKLTKSQEAELIAILPQLMARPVSEYNATACVFCGSESGLGGQYHLENCLGLRLLRRLEEKP